MQRTLQRLRGEFLEMPGLRLTVQQVQRLCGVDPAICQAILDALVEAKFLCIKRDGSYGRLTDGETVRSAPAPVLDRATVPRRSLAAHATARALQPPSPRVPGSDGNPARRRSPSPRLRRPR